MQVKIQKWGNSLAMRIPKSFAFQARIGQDEYVNLTLDDDKIIVESVEKKQFTLKELVAGIKKSNLHREIDSGDKMGAEHW